MLGDAAIVLVVESLLKLCIVHNAGEFDELIFELVFQYRHLNCPLEA